MTTYFSFTSLSTVGFGDYHPKNNYERSLVAFILLFGVAIFSYILGEFLNIVDRFTSFNKPYDEGSDLNKFLGTLCKFNGNYPLDADFISSFESYFEHKWSDDRNLAFIDDQDLKIYYQMPLDVQTQIYKSFLFKDVLHIYRHYFSLRRFDLPHKNAFFTWDSDQYRDFMIDILRTLCPRLEARNTILFSNA